MSEPLEELEHHRKNCRTGWYLGLAVSFVGVLLGGLMGFAAWEEGGSLFQNAGVLLVLLVVGGIGGAVVGFCLFYNRKYKSYNALYKDWVIRGVLADVFESLLYEPGKGLTREAIAGTGMVPMGNRFESDDYIRGLYRDVPLYQSDVTVRNVVRRGRNTREDTYFNGKWMIFELNLPEKELVHIRGKEFLGASKGSAVNLPKWKTGDPEFDREFLVFSNSEQAVQSLVSTRFMEGVRTLRQANGKRQLLICFYNGSLHVAIDSMNSSLDAPVFQAIDESVWDLARRDVRQITDFVDLLDLCRQ